MSEKCPVCKTGCEMDATVCSVCGFSDNGFINRSFPIPEDTKDWLETVVKPYRTAWEARKQKEELQAQLEAAKAQLDAATQREGAAKQREAELLAEIEAAKMSAQPQTRSASSAAPKRKGNVKEDLISRVCLAVFLVVVAVVGIYTYVKELPLPKNNVGGSAASKAAPQPNGGSFIDSRNGLKYRTIKIGNQTWMAENLNYKTDNSWCYGGDESNCKKYGRLYDWNTAKNACPKGWHLPSTKEWDNLVEVAGGKEIAGKKLKSKTGWDKRKDGTSGNGTDDFGFSALPGGFRDYSDGSFDDVGDFGLWWSASEYGSVNAYNRGMNYSSDYVNEYYDDKSRGFSVRCVAVAQD